MKQLLGFGLLELLLLCGLSAATINWRSRAVIMDGVDGAAQAELGTFGSFTPTRENVSEWLENWQAVDSTPYDEENGLFASTADFTDVLSGSAYLWLADFSGNWILLTNSNWQWPAGEFPPPFPRDFFTTDPGTIAVLGTLTQDSATEHLETEFVAAPAHPSIYAGWLRMNGLGDQPGDDDGDGFSNLEEFARGGDPKVAGDLSCVTMVSRPVRQLIIPGTIHPQIRLELLASEDLKSWITVEFEQTQEGSNVVLLPEDLGPKQFFRVRYSLLK